MAALRASTNNFCVTKHWKELIKAVKHITANDLNVLYNRNGLIAISKPYGLPVHSGPGQGKSIIDLMKDFQEIHDLKECPRLVHRLDKNCCGVMLLTCTEDMTRKMSELFHERKINKMYYGVTRGVPKSPYGLIDDSICEAVIGGKKRYRMTTVSELEENRNMLPSPNSKVKKAYTAYKVLDSNRDSCSLVEFVAKTGLKHQIRLHSACSLGAPILGDHKFSEVTGGIQSLPLRLMQLLQMKGIRSKDESKKPHIQVWQRALVPLHLFAESIEIPEIKTNGKYLRIKAPMPEYFAETLFKCDLHPKRQRMVEYQERKKLNQNR